MKRSVAPESAVTAAAGESMDTDGGGSSSSIVPVPVAAVVGSAGSVAFVGPLNLTSTVSFGSSSVSPATVTSTFLLVSPAAKVSAPAASAV